MIAIGPENFTAMLAGMHDVDELFRATPLARNIPALMGLLSIWYNNFLGAQTHAVLPWARSWPSPSATNSPPRRRRPLRHDESTSEHIRRCRSARARSI